MSRRTIYNLLLTVLVPAWLARLWWRGRRLPAYRQRLAERRGHWGEVPAGGVWVHAVSVGESRVAADLIRRLQADGMSGPYLVTTVTPTGAATVSELLGEEVIHRYLPLDRPAWMRRALEAARPRMLVLMETEIWPNLITLAGCPVILVNARLSRRSARGYSRVNRWFKDVWPRLWIAAQTRADARRFAVLGVPRSQITITGNLKYDQSPPDASLEQAQALRHAWGVERPVWIAASTHEGEEPAVLAAFKRLRVDHPDLLLVLVPRHPDRFDRVAALCRDAGWSTARRGRGDSPDRNTAIYLGDTLGDMWTLYAASDIAFVGGSLAPVGGHNVLEPARLGKPVVFGPNMHNFHEAGRLLLRAGGAVRIQHGTELEGVLETLLSDRATRRQIGAHARLCVGGGGGALSRTRDWLQVALSR